MLDRSSSIQPLRSLLAAVTGVIGCMVLGGLTQTVPSWRTIDATWLARIRTSTPDAFLPWLEGVGYGGHLVVIIPLAVVLAGSLWHRQLRATALYWTLTVISGEAIVLGLKWGVGRTRPAAPGALRDDFSFPSGHAFNAVLLYGAILLLSWSQWKAAWARWAAALIVSGLILVIGWSRLALGVHYPTDVLGGFALGAAWVAFFRASLHYRAIDASISSSTRSSR